MVHKISPPFEGRVFKGAEFPENDLDTATAHREQKLFATLAARLAMFGCVVIKGDPSIDDQAPYFLVRLGFGLQPVHSIDTVSKILSQLDGASDGKELQKQ